MAGRISPVPPYGVSPKHTSVPAPTGIAFDASARLHVVVATAIDADVCRLISDAGAVGAETVVLSTFDLPDGAQRPERRRLREDHLEDDIVRLLDRATTGLHLYIAGSQSVLDRTRRVAYIFGLADETVSTHLVGSLRRRVFCVHCKTVTPDVEATVVACAGCARQLLVYHHFSRRWSAFMGFQVDAEAPGELPEIDRAWP